MRGSGYDRYGDTAGNQCARSNAQSHGDYREHHYHQPTDEFDPKWDLSGPIQDLQALYAFGQALGNGDKWPNWYQGNEFRAIRDKSRAGK